ncbi:MAG: acyl-[Prevotella sp.]|nr:acyl-[acyl-carrier-protein] thioesterase [Prevotella sp.]
MIEKIGKYDFMAEPFHCDFAGRLFMSHLGNHLINAADFHSNDRGFGMIYLNSIGKTWVLSRLAVEMTEMPRAYERFSVETWVESAMRFFTNRNFRISSPDSEKIYGYGRSVWAMIDVATRQPVDLFSVNDGVLKDYVEAEKECPIAKPWRVRISDEAKLARTLVAQYSDIDMNGHVNSLKYIEHILNLWDSDWYAAHPLRRFDIAYVSEAHLGDELCLFVETVAEGREYAMRVTRRSAVDEEPVEACRCLIVFD